MLLMKDRKKGPRKALQGYGKTHALYPIVAIRIDDIYNNKKL